MPVWLEEDQRPLDWNGPIDQDFVRFPDRAQYFAGWLPRGRLYVISSRQRVEGWPLTGPDPTRGRVVVCRLPAGTCETVARVPGLRDVVVPGAPSLLG